MAGTTDVAARVRLFGTTRR